MAPFRYGHDDLEHPLDWVLLQNSPVTLYRKRGGLDEDVAELRELGYEVHRFDCSTWKSFTWKRSYKKMNESFKRELPGFADYCGDNFNALRDCLEDLNVPEDGGMAVVFENFLQHGSEGDVMLDAFADASRLWSLFGRRLIVLVQVDDPSYDGPPDLGAKPAQWNGREWMTEDRYDPSELSQG